MSNLPILLTNPRAVQIRQIEQATIDAIEKGQYNIAISYLKRLIKEMKKHGPQIEIDE